MEEFKTYHKWTKAEKEKLLELHKKRDSWGGIEKKMNEHFHTDVFTEINCSNCFKDLGRVNFSPAEDAKLKKLVLQYGTNNWEQIALSMPGRNARRCRDRYENYLRPDIDHSRFTADEDTIILNKVKEIGKKWQVIAQFLSRRSAVQIRNRYNNWRKRQPTKKSEKMPAVITVKERMEVAKEKSQGQNLEQEPYSIQNLLVH